MRGRLVSLVIPRFSLVSSLVSTQELLLSEPEAASVSTVPTGRVVSGFVPVDANCHGSVLVATPMAMAFAESITEPPPTAQHKVDALSLCQCNALANKRYLRVRRYTAQFNKGKTRRKQALFHTVEQTWRCGALEPPEVYEDAMCAEFFQTRANLFLNIFTKYNLSRGVQIKIQH